MPKSLSYYLTQDEEEAVNDLLAALSWNDDLAANTQNHAVDFIKRIRKTRRKAGSLESFFEQYGLNTSEGLALMSMAEALLRIPDPKTASALIRDKVAGTNWLKSASATDKDWMTKAAGLGLKLTGSTMNSLFSKLGEPVIRQAMGRAMKILGKQFVIGENLSAAMKVAHKFDDQNFRFSYDMLGEGARTASDATRYFEGYKTALQALADGEQEDTQSDAPANRSGISIKLSALHPRYELAQSDRCITPLTNKLIELCEIAAKANIGLTIDAEEVARLDPSLKIIENICLQPQFSTWRGFGLAVQAYQKSAAAILDHVIGLARTYDRHLQVRLVKGAYWDTEIKHAQVEGYANYPVFTRKSNTDLSYLRCAQKLLKNRDVLYPMFGTHNAHTVAAILEMAKLYEYDDKKSFEFQKLFGMGDALYNLVANDEDITVCVYAPVGPYEDLLPYLVRRMLENGANSSFVNQIYDKTFEPADIADDPVVKSARRTVKHHPNISLPKDIYGARRLNSKGFDFDDPDAVKALLKSISSQYAQKSYKAAPILNGKKQKGVTVTEVTNPVNQKDVVGKVTSTALSSVDDIISAAQTGQKIWSSTAPQVRAKTLEKIADKLEENETELMALCVREGGRTLKDAHAEIREAVDFCRYYAMRGMIDFDPVGRTLVSPTGESNIFRFKSRGIFVCISPWNFPLAIFTGQIVAALMAGNAVIAKPAEQTNLIGCLITRLMHEAGVPPEVLSFAPGDGQVGAALVERDEIAGVAFTGSTEVAKIINQSLAAKEGAIPKLIAETGGQNAMIVDSSALTEQVVDDVMLSAFGSAGQRCSACRILYLQDEIADKTILMLQGALAELRVGDPSDLSSDIGPLIDEEALMIVQKHKSALSGFGHKLAEAPLDNQLKAAGNFFAPAIFEIDSLNALEREIFGPILHVIRYKASDIDAVIDEINDTGYGLTFGIHSRIDSFIDDVSSRIHAGNVYVNRGTIGAVVGVQPFGGRGLSGTGPKAGGPYYLHGFATEQVISTDTTAAGGNASLVMIEE